MTGASLRDRAGGPADLSRSASQPEALIPSAHTPGPWVAEFDGDWWMVLTKAEHPIDEFWGPAQAPVVDLHHGGYDYSELGLGTISGNARLIASAPELLEAAEKALAIAESWIHDQLDGTSMLDDELAQLEPVRAAIAKARGAA